MQKDHASVSSINTCTGIMKDRPRHLANNGHQLILCYSSISQPYYTPKNVTMQKVMFSVKLGPFTRYTFLHARLELLSIVILQTYLLSSKESKEHVERNLNGVQENEAMLGGDVFEVDEMHERPNLPRSLASSQ